MVGESASPIRVLCVDDGSRTAETTATHLEELDERFDVETVTGACAGIEYLGTSPVDCIVCDHPMPDLDGITFFETVRIEYPDLSFLFFTGPQSRTWGDVGPREPISSADAVDERYGTLAEQILSAVEGGEPAARS